MTAIATHRRTATRRIPTNALLACLALLAAMSARAVGESAGPGWYVAMASHADARTARAALPAMTARTGYPVTLVSADTASGTRVRIASGPWRTRDDAERVRTDLAVGIPDAWVFRVAADAATNRAAPASPPSPSPSPTPTPSAVPARTRSAAVVDSPAADGARAAPVGVTGTDGRAPPASPAAAPTEPTPAIDPEVGVDDRARAAGNPVATGPDLRDVVAEALLANPELRAGAAGLEVGLADVRIARSPLLPQVDLAFTGEQIDRDRAEASNGRAPEYRSLARLGVSQTLWSEEFRARYDVEAIRQQARALGQETLLLDVVARTGGAYLEVLRAEALARIREQELALNRSNYERAEVRLRLGVANRAELYRWETARARSHQDVNAAEANVRAAREQLARLRGADASADDVLVDPSMDAPWLLVSRPELRQALDAPERHPALRRWLLDSALANAPELARIDAERKAQERALASARRSLAIPELVATADITQEMGRGGAGTGLLDFDFAEIFPQVAGGNSQIGGDIDKTEWRIGVTASIPVWQGGRRYAQIRRLQSDIDRLQYERDAVLARVRADVLARAHSATSSWANIGYARTAATAGANNHRLVQEAYERGVVTIIDVLDAQVAKINAELSAANAVYDFLIDWIAVQRAAGRFDLLATDAERDAWLDELDARVAREPRDPQESR